MRLPALSGIGDEVVADATRPRAGVLGPPFFIARPTDFTCASLGVFLFFVFSTYDWNCLRHTC